LNSKSDRSEWFDILDPSDTRTIIGKKLRKEVHRDGDWHRAVHVWLFRSTDRSVLLQLRSAQKDTHPLCWDVSAAGHLQSGEHDLLAAAKRELEEELGMTDSEPELLFEVYSENLGQDIRDREVQSVYVVRLPQVTVSAGRNVTEEAAQQPVFRLQEEEVVQVRWMPITDYLAALEQRQAGYVPRPPAYIKQLRAALGKI
jgi:isopentenyldiphosphate isomerase